MPYCLPASVSHTLIDLSEAFIPTDGLVPITPKEKFIADFNRMIAEFPWLFRMGFLLMIMAFKWLPCLHGFGFKNFSQLSLDDRLEYLSRWSDSRLHWKRGFFKAVRGLAMIVKLNDEAVWQYLEYDPAVHMRERIELRRKLTQ